MRNYGHKTALKLTDKIIESVIEQRTDGVPVADVATNHNISISLVYKAIYQHHKKNGDGGRPEQLVRKIQKNSQVDNMLIRKRAKPKIKYKTCPHQGCKTQIPSTDDSCALHYHVELVGCEPSPEYAFGYIGADEI